MLASIIFHASKVVHLNVTNVTTEEYVFRDHRFITTLMMFVFAEQSYELYFDTGYIINLIDRKFLFEIFSNIIIKKMSTLMIIRDININMYNVNEYVRLQMYLFDKNNIIKIKKKITSSITLLSKHWSTLTL